MKLFNLLLLLGVLHNIFASEIANISFQKSWTTGNDITITNNELTIIGDVSKYQRTTLDVNVSTNTTDVYFVAEIYLEGIELTTISYKAPKMKIYQGGTLINIRAFNLVETPDKKWFVTGMKLERFDKLNLSQIRLEFGMQNVKGIMKVKNPQLLSIPPAMNFSFPFDVPQGPVCNLSIDTNEKHLFDNNLLSANSHFTWASLDWGDTQVKELITNKFPMKNMRFPGGTVGNFYEWESDGFYNDEWGKLNSSAVKGFQNNFKFDYSGYKDLCIQNNSSATLMFNVISDSVPKAKKRLQSRLNDGLDIAWVEMGNENFFDKQNYGNVSSLAKYITHTKALSQGLKEVNPTIQTAINIEHSTYDEGGWNVTLSKENYYDAVVTHPYINTNTFLLNDFSVRQMFSSYNTTTERIHEYKQYFSKPLLFTEWSILSEGTPVNFAQTLGLADMFLAIEEGSAEGVVKQAGLHMLYHSDNYNEATLTYLDQGKMVLTANGVWYSSLFEFFQNRQVFNAKSTSSILENGVESIYAKAVETKDSIYVYAINKLPVSAPLNLSINAVQYVDAYKMKSFTEDLNKELTTPYQLDNLPWTKITGTGIADLPPYSISIVSLPKNVVTSIPHNSNLSTISISPNPTKNKVRLSENANWSLFTAQGQLLEEGKGNVVDLSTYTHGMYIIQIGSQSFKIIKE